MTSKRQSREVSPAFERSCQRSGSEWLCATTDNAAPRTPDKGNGSVVAPPSTDAVANGPESASRYGSVKSIRCISTEEQKEHIKLQILRNKASRRSPRAEAVSEQPSHSRGSPLLRQAARNRRAASIEKHSKDYADLNQRALVADNIGGIFGRPLHAEDEYPGNDLSDRTEHAAAAQLRGQTHSDFPATGPMPERSNLASVMVELDAGSTTSSPSRVIRAREEKRRAGSFPLDQRNQADRAPREEDEDILDYALNVVSSVLSEIAQQGVDPKSLGPRLSEEDKAASEYATSMIDEVPLMGESTSAYEADISDNQSIFNKRTSGLRTRRRSPHSRLTTPLSMYDFELRTPTVG